MREQTVEKIKNAGVVGAGGAGLPTHIKTNATVDTVLVNGASCEPLLMSDPYLMRAEAEAVLQGLEAVVDCTGASKGIVCLKGKHEKAMAAMQEAIRKTGTGRLSVFEMKDFYPAGDEQVMVHEVLERTVPEGGLPLQVGVVVSNVETLYNVAQAMHGHPVTDRYLTVTGEVGTPMVLKVPVGTIVSDVLTHAGGARISEYKVVDGGPMMGRVLPNTTRPITKTTSGLIVLPPDHNVVSRKTMAPERVRRITNTICCQCSFCTDLCPRKLLGHSLHPHKLMRIPDNQIVSSKVAREALLCSECGVCEKFACPMLVSPREVNAQIKRRLREAGVKWEGSGRQLAPHQFRESRYISTKRLVQRLGLVKYDVYPEFAGEFVPSLVTIPLSQHIGAPAESTVAVGDRVIKGDLIGEIPGQSMGARVHASISGIVERITDGLITIRA